MAIEWVKKGTAGGPMVAADKDVYVSAPKRGGGAQSDVRSAAFSFRFGSEKRITASKYMIAGLEGGRVYFCGANPEDGYKLVDNSGKANTYTLRCTDERMARVCGKCKGGYNLEYDKIEGLYYIQLVKSEGRK